MANGLISLVVKHIVGAKGLGFDFRAGQIGHNVVTGSPPLQHFETVLPKRLAAEIGPATRYKLRRNSASVIKV